MPQSFFHAGPLTQEQWAQQLSLHIVQAVRSRLYLQLPYLNAALCELSPCPQSTKLSAFATDGARLCYSPSWLIRVYRANRSYLPRAFLHSVLHCLFRHPWLRGRRDPALWNLACDIAVESVLDALTVPAICRPVGWVRQQTYAALRDTHHLGVLAAAPVYRVLQAAFTEAGGSFSGQADNPTPETLQKLCREFFCDSHALWPKDSQNAASQSIGRRWENLGRQSQLEAEQHGRSTSSEDAAHALAVQLEAGKSRRLYRDFLRKFAVLREEAHLSPDEFDLGYYAYGLRTYGNLPLLEPLETREINKIRTFVVVIDTSASTSGELVRAFLRETFSLLQNSGGFFSQCRILVLQCDNAVRSETLLTDLRELNSFIANFTLKGGGGTDFRPAFVRVEQLRVQGVLPELKGLLYFTDGKGCFPAKRPDYETAFLFLETGVDLSTSLAGVPPWAMRLVLAPEEFLPSPTATGPDVNFTKAAVLPDS